MSSNAVTARSLKIPTKFVEKARFVRVIFTDVEKEYDALLHLMTFGLDWTWRRRMISRINFHRATRILDLACGTGLVTFALSRYVNSRALVVGLDPSCSMLQSAIKKKHATTTSCDIELIRATGEFMPLRNGLFEYETIGLALRNLGDKSAVFSEAHRTLADSGWFLSVDFVIPTSSLIQRLYMFYIFNVLPSLGRLVSSSWHRTLTYLARSIQLSAPPAETCKVLSRNGFQRTLSEKITLGVVALIGGRR
jgi:demethylmenaquinone methyltransferase/2-methoxy-6-polyprenyl-1,4-benzoquinol methylase